MTRSLRMNHHPVDPVKVRIVTVLKVREVVMIAILKTAAMTKVMTVTIILMNIAMMMKTMVIGMMTREKTMTAAVMRGRVHRC